MTNPKTQTKLNNQKPKFQTYDLEERTFQFAKQVRAFVKKLPRTTASIRDSGQLIDASGSIGANYIEAKADKCFYIFGACLKFWIWEIVW